MSSIEDAIAAMWEEPVRVERLDLAKRVLVLAIGPEGNPDRPVRYLQLEGVSAMTVKLGHTNAWKYAEATEVGLIDYHTLDILLWDDPDTLTVTFAEAHLDTEPPAN